MRSFNLPTLLQPALHRVLQRLGIVTQGADASKQTHLPRNILPMTTRLGFLGAIAFIMWWSWPMPPDATTSLNLLAAITTPTVAGADTLAILDPANLPGAQTTPLAEGALPSIVTLPGASAPNPPSNEDAPAGSAPAGSALAGSAIVSDELTLITTTTAILVDPVVPVSAAAPVAEVDLVLVPTATPTEEPVVPVSELPQVQILADAGFALPTLPPPTATPAPRVSPTPAPVNVKPGRLWSTFTPPASGNDHFWVARPFAPSIANQLAAPSYQFGSTAGNSYRPHHGVDIANPFGTPVLSGVDGEVIHAGPDDTILIGPYNNFYGNTVVIRLDRRLPVAGGRLDVYLLYGHLSQVNVAVGQIVRPEDVVGQVGMTGIAIGPHLHVEMRLGANTYQHSVNPYLWLQPLEGTGAVAVRLLTAEGRTIPGARLTLARFENNVAVWGRLIETYLDTENVSPDPAWGENGAMDGAPAGSYYLVGVVNGESIRAELTVKAGETTFVEIRTKQ